MTDENLQTITCQPHIGDSNFAPDGKRMEKGAREEEEEVVGFLIAIGGKGVP